MADLPAEKLVEAHGSFATSQCIDCHTAVTDDWMRAKVLSGKVAYCEEERCKKRSGGKGGLVKPDIVFFGEGLPNRFFECIPDLKKADLLIVLGTSLQVQPFASLMDRVPASCPRVLINLERVGEIASYGTSSGGLDRFFGGMRGLMNETGFDFEGWTLGKGMGKEHIRDVFYQGKCDDAILELAKGAGWEKELLDKHASLIERIDAENKAKGDDKIPSTNGTAEKNADEAASKISAQMTESTKDVKEGKQDATESVADQLKNLALDKSKNEKQTTEKNNHGSSL